MIKLYNTLARKKQEFVPLEKSKVKMYVCGPTVYDVPHIGHARSAYVFDVIRRYFEYKGLGVCFVRNVTDIDDKIINKAKDELREAEEPVTSENLKRKILEVTARYLDLYHDRMRELGIKEPEFEPKATENISKIIDFIKVLIDKACAYVSRGNVYFSVESFLDYGRLSRQNKDEMLHAVRIEPDENKKHPLDFVLWKKNKEQEPFWESPWGCGRPGWHIECSVMSINILGDNFDIHGGGVDLVFPHHENEIAQARSATGSKFANYWIHNGLVTVNGEKMSKSLGNYVTIGDFLMQHKDTDILKLMFLNSHYRSPLDYNEEKVNEVKRSKERVMIFLEKTDSLKLCAKQASLSDKKEKYELKINGLKEKFDKAMNDDFNTPLAISIIFEMVKLGNGCLVERGCQDSVKAEITEIIKKNILERLDIFSLSLSLAGTDKNLKREIEKLIAEREKARKKKDFSGADIIRGKLAAMGIMVEDTPEGTIWRKN